MFFRGREAKMAILVEKVADPCPNPITSHHKSLSPASPVSPSLKWDNVKKELEGFAAMACSCQGGRINIQEFATFLKLPINPALQELFALFDRVSDGGVRRTHS